ncbi:hypothetical protein SAMN05444007_103397 [Cribrihabitans marinus]|uniref:Lambda phage tail tube protein N-terminal domain-containing protein n=1 Tax=Cribrihabitans marinus TaxID=1227549 RepID=A0A1H6WM59_9RHOB|nr:phage tail tube protein [Cribrihabitans marinus]GGH24433.1 hypothetical protein GCM10010973_10930 [Cribrihabitans marinus]SEJ13445.1 hypothetical protein SAMN05444007_103397 [Cribrihabitans marinus]
MPAEKPDIGHGSTAEISVDGGTTFISVDRMEGIEFPNPTFDDVDVTHFSSPNRTREFIAGLGDNGEVTISFQHLPGSTLDVALRAALGSNAVLRLVENGGVAEDFDVVVKGYQRNIPMDDKMTAALTLRVGGEWESV